MRKLMALLILLCCILSAGSGIAAGKALSFTRITQEEAKEMMAEYDDAVILDVRTLEEYASGHIPGAICIPNETIYKERPEELPDLDQIILVYCRSGNRSKRSARMLYEMGYTNVYEFGGINDWDGEIVTEETETEETGKTDESETPERTISEFFVSRTGEINYDSYRITLDPDGYYISVNGETGQPVGTDTVEALMDVIESFDVASWDGFDKSAKYVLDGEGFSLEIQFTDGSSISARGDNRFPDRYFEAMGEIWEILT